LAVENYALSDLVQSRPAVAIAEAFQNNIIGIPEGQAILLERMQVMMDGMETRLTDGFNTRLNEVKEELRPASTP